MFVKNFKLKKDTKEKNVLECSMTTYETDYKLDVCFVERNRCGSSEEEQIYFIHLVRILLHDSKH